MTIHWKPNNSGGSFQPSRFVNPKNFSSLSFHRDRISIPLLSLSPIPYSGPPYSLLYKNAHQNPHNLPRRRHPLLQQFHRHPFTRRLPPARRSPSSPPSTLPHNAYCATLISPKMSPNPSSSSSPSAPKKSAPVPSAAGSTRSPTTPAPTPSAPPAAASSTNRRPPPCSSIHHSTSPTLADAEAASSTRPFSGLSAPGAQHPPPPLYRRPAPGRNRPPHPPPTRNRQKTPPPRPHQTPPLLRHPRPTRRRPPRSARIDTRHIRGFVDTCSRCHRRSARTGNRLRCHPGHRQGSFPHPPLVKYCKNLRRRRSPRHPPRNINRRF